MKLIKQSLVICIGASLLGCNKYLDKNPDNRTDLNSVSNVSELLATAYPQASYILFADAMSDNSDDKGDGKGTLYSDIENYYTFTDFASDSKDSPQYYWDNAYEAIAAANQALDAISKASNPQDYSAQKGEALICRAYAHFMLVSLFSKIYDPATASSDMGIPYVTEPETIVFKKYDRGTVQQDYDKIEQDLLEGLPLINNSAYTVPKFHFTKAAAEAFATRFYLFKQDYRNAVNHANLVFPSGNIIQNMRPWLTDYQGYTSDGIKTDYTNATENANLLLVEAPSNQARYFAKTRFGWTVDIRTTMMKDANVTGNSNWAFRVFTTGGSENVHVPKWLEYFYAPTDPSFGTPYVMVPLFSTEEVLLNRAEAYANLGLYDSSLSDLNLYASQRFKNYDASANKITTNKATAFYNTSDIKEALIDVVLDFKRNEFIQEGQRWFDDLRHKITIKHYIRDQNLNIIDSVIVKPDDPRRVLQLPQSVSLSGLPMNPR